MSLARVHNFSISLDGFGTGEPQSREAPFGHAGERLHQWMFATRWWHEMGGEPGGSGGVDDAFAQQFAPGIGAEIMGAESSARPDGTRTRSGRAGGVPTRHSTHRSSSSPITRARRSRWRAARRSTSSTPRRPRHSRRPARPRTARTYASAEAPPWSATSSPPGSSTTCTWWWSRSCSAEAYASGTDWRASRRTTDRGHLVTERSHARDVHPLGRELVRVGAQRGRQHLREAAGERPVDRHLTR